MSPEGAQALVKLSDQFKQIVQAILSDQGGGSQQQAPTRGQPAQHAPMETGGRPSQQAY